MARPTRPTPRRSATGPRVACDPGPAPRLIPRRHPRLETILRAARAVRSDWARRRWSGGEVDALGLRAAGHGGQREAFFLSRTEVLKVDHIAPDDEDNLHECQVEADRWRLAPRDEALLLCPVLAAGEGWVVMAAAGDYDAGPSPSEPEWPALHLLSGDATELNVGWFCGRLVLLDYGR
jgi:hypothetical protein